MRIRFAEQRGKQGPSEELDAPTHCETTTWLFAVATVLVHEQKARFERGPSMVTEPDPHTNLPTEFLGRICSRIFEELV